MAKLYFRYSAMNSGKTTALIQTAHNYEERGMRVLVLKPAVDTKGDETIVSRLGISRRVDLRVASGDSITTRLEPSLASGDLRCILIDEAQFLDPEQIDELFWLAVERDIPVIAFGLRTDFTTTGFPASSRLLELAHDLQEIKTICRCGRKALFNGRKINGQFVSEGEQIAIEDNKVIEYESLCGACYKQLVLQ